MIRPDMIGIRPLRPAVNAPLAVESPIVYSNSAFFPVTRQGMTGGVMSGCRSSRVLPPPQPVLVLRDEVCKSAGYTISVPYHEELKTKPLVSDIEGNSFHLHPSGKLIHPHTGEVHGTYRWGRYKNRTFLEATPKKEGMVYESGSNEVLTPGVKPHVPPSHLRKSADDKKSDDWISDKIRLLMHEGKPQKQAIAIAYSMAGRSKVKKSSIETCDDLIKLSKALSKPYDSGWTAAHSHHKQGMGESEMKQQMHPDNHPKWNDGYHAAMNKLRKEFVPLKRDSSHWKSHLQHKNECSKIFNRKKGHDSSEFSAHAHASEAHKIAHELPSDHAKELAHDMTSIASTHGHNPKAYFGHMKMFHERKANEHLDHATKSGLSDHAISLHERAMNDHVAASHAASNALAGKSAHGHDFAGLKALRSSNRAYAETHPFVSKSLNLFNSL